MPVYFTTYRTVIASVSRQVAFSSASAYHARRRHTRSSFTSHMTANSYFEGAPVPNILHPASSPIPHFAAASALAELPPHLCSAGRHPQSGGCGDRVIARGEARAGAGDDGCCCPAKIHLLRVALFESLMDPALLTRVGAQTRLFGHDVIGCACNYECCTVQCV